ncbi:hypothetical protein PRIPAC_74225 [Pristionchus pacificus]|uniref:Reverse transcriptase domain-containing protein n=1 Tax=Pristionchus pacificus TaxID=54126 RepID=A0A2A6CF47_PRIPA|nr:hypothetical protein PRIPAC_74225 [Pristionchus pacificus]|eukprot:PDM76736.1 hypothetical protein PRIPAC_42131 [Pristionchus pacificus]
MSSKYESTYSDLQSHLSNIKPQLISIDDEITKLLSASTSDEITDLSASIAKGVDNIHSIILDYSDIVNSVKDGITTMEDESMKNDELEQFNGKMASTDGASGLPMNPVCLSGKMAKLETRFTRCLSTASMRVAAIERITKPNLSTPPVHPSMSIHSTHDNHVPSVPSIDSTAVFQSLIDRIATIESYSKRTPNLSLPPIKLECFDGSDITKYPAYKYQLDQLILNNSSLNEVEKAYHVRSSLKGAALSLVSSIPTHQNFLKRITERLELEYGRSDLTQATLLQSLLRIRAKSIKLDDQLEAVRSMINLVQTIDEGSGINGLLTQQQLVDRIHPRFIAVVWKRKPATLLAALEFIEETLRLEQEEATITNAISERTNPTQNSTVTHFGNSSSKSQRPAAMGNSKVPYDKQSSNLPIPLCVFCESHTYSAACTTVKSVKDRKAILRSKSLCYCCFSSKHSSAECSRKCGICSEKHHKALCEKPPSTSFNALSIDSKQPERLFTVKAKVSNPVNNSIISAHVHLDHGAQATLISRNLMNRLSLVPIEQREMTITGINDNNARSSTYDIVQVEVVTNHGRRIPIEAVVHESSSVNSIHSHPLSDSDLHVIKTTLGYIPKHFSRSTVVHTDSIGTLVVGSNKSRSRAIDSSVSALTTHVDTVESLESKIERLFSVDTAARVYETTEKEARKVSNELVNKHFEDTVEKQGDEYIVKYSVKPEAATVLPSNYDLAVSRLSSTIRTLSKQRSYLGFYDSIIDDQLHLGQIEKVDPNDNEGIVHYLAHQPVLRPDKPTTPLRIVYDASAHLKNKPSLNDMIHPGPSDLERIPAILLRARSRKSLIVADVEKAFLQVKLHPSQRNMLRFLWIKDLDKPVSSQNILVLRFCVTPFGVNASPSLLNKVIQHHIELTSSDCDPRLIHQLVSNLYVDNVIVNIDHPTLDLYSQSKRLFKTMSMNLRDYSSNSSTFNSLVPEIDRSKDVVQKLLGLLWNSSTDQLSINIPISNKEGKTTCIDFHLIRYPNIQ